MTVAESGIREWERDLVLSRGSCSGQDRQSDRSCLAEGEKESSPHWL